MNQCSDNHICILCASKEFNEIPLYSTILDLAGNVISRVVRCHVCNGLFLYPYVSNDFLNDMYGKAYFSGEDGNYNGSFDIAGSGDNHEEIFELSRIEKFKHTIGELINIKPDSKNILDVGAATGQFLVLAEEAGLSISGVEYSDYAVSEAKTKHGFDLFCGDILDYEPLDKFDLIHLNHVFEHVVSPPSVAKKLGQLISPGGLVYIEVPFQFNFIEYVKSKVFNINKKFNIHSIHHTVFYRPSTLNMVMSDAGFDVIKLELFHWRRYPTDTVYKKLKAIFWMVSALLGQGNYIEAIYKKKY